MVEEHIMEPIKYKPSTRFTRELTKQRRKEFERNITEDGVYVRTAVCIMIPRLEHYVRENKIALIEIANTGVTLVLHDSSRVRV